MKKLILLLAFIAVFSTGCARRYVMTMENGNQITSHGKPVLKDGAYMYSDATGKQRAISSARVREIAPASMAGKSSNSGFSAKPKK
jgi:hypothetical protein